MWILKVEQQHFNTIQFLKKLLLTTFLFLTILLLPTRVTFAQNCADVNFDDPGLVQIVCPVMGVINMIILSAGVVFVAMVIIASYKYATSLGDPKAAMGAKNTLTYSIMGLVAVVGVYVMFSIIGGAFGFKQEIIGGGVFGTIQTNICEFLENSTSSGGPIVGSPAGCP